MENSGIGSWIERRRVKSATHAAVIYDESVTTYAQLAERVNRLASGLRMLGVAKGDRVAYLGDNHPSFIETLFAVTTLGAVFVPLNTRLAPAELAYMIEDSNSRVLVHGSRFGAVDTAVKVQVGAELDTLVDSGDPVRIDIEVSHDDPAVILYTSGTTGRPKGAVLSHGNLVWNAINTIVDYDLTSEDRALMISPLFHSASLGMGTLPSILKGATVVLEAAFDPARTLAQIERHRITYISGVPTTYQLLCEHPDWATTDLGSLRTITCGGSPVPMRVLEAYEQRGLAFTGGYGMTETGPGATSLQPDHSRDRAGSAGLPHFFTDVRIVDEAGRDTAAGEIGELQVRGPNVIMEYWHRPDASAEAFAPGGWFRSGDLGYTDDQGFVYISDRLKDMIISGGENIYAAEVELAIMQLADVSAVAVIAMPDEKWGEVPVAVLTVRDEAIVDEARLLEHLGPQLAKYKIPKRVIVVDELPRTASGKVRKADLRERFSR
ncbi:MAG: p-hydroxycinnamoyl-CoA synthetase [Microbacteriaceae bacterium]|nr:p-hydroxycinnamoyl-CoA synthetase [Microbacteriaceae bacterium]